MPSAITRRGTRVSWNGGHGLQVFAGRLFAFSSQPRLLALPAGPATWQPGWLAAPHLLLWTFEIHRSSSVRVATMATSTSALALLAGISSHRVGISRPKRAAPRARRIPRIIAEASSSSQARDAFVLGPRHVVLNALASLIDDPDASKAFDVVVCAPPGSPVRSWPISPKRAGQPASPSAGAAMRKLCSLVGSMVESGDPTCCSRCSGATRRTPPVRALARVASASSPPRDRTANAATSSSAAPRSTHYADLTGEPG